MDPDLEYFPYEPRHYQKEAIASIRSAVEEGKNFCLHAPTGFGKTPVVLAALLPLIEGMKGSIIWTVRTGNETDRPIEELAMVNKKRRVFGLSFRGKRDMCLLARELNVKSYEGVGTLCRMKRDKCLYYRNLKRMRDLLIPSEPLTFSEIFEIAKKMKVCPYFLQIALLEYSHVISLSYNYILSPLGWVIRRKIPFRESILIIDEAHNINRAAIEMNSKSITSTTVERSLREAEKYDPNDEYRLREKIERLSNFMLKVTTSKDGTFYLEDLLSSTDFTPEDIRFIYKLANDIYKDRIIEGKEPRSYLNSLADFLVAALEKKGEDGVAYLYSRDKERVKLEVWDMRARDILASIWKDFHSVIFISGTLEPIDAFAETTGVEKCARMSVPSTADPDKVKSIIIEGVSTKGEELSREMVGRYFRVIDTFLSLPRNLAIFTASYRIQDEVLPSIEELSGRHNCHLFIEKKDMPGDEASNMLDEFKLLPKQGKIGLLVAPSGGRFAEGADFPGEELEGVMLLGIPFDRLTTKTRLFIQYSQRVYGTRRGRYLAYVVPALRRASQALGRVIRSEEDGGIFIMADERYAKRTYFKLLPDFIKQTVNLARWNELRSL